MNYSIASKYRSGEDDHDIPWNEVNDCGSFRSTVDFTINNQNGTQTKVNGIIVQYIQKTTAVDIYDENGGGILKTLSTSQEISRYTDGNVKYMNDSYLEYFDVKNGESIDGDQFGNGPICKYDNSDPIVDDELDMGHGKIIQNGYAVFIPTPISNQIKKKFAWNNDPNLPANGLFSLAFEPQTWDYLLNLGQSRVYIHNVIYEWRYLNIIEQNRSISYVDVCKENNQNISKVGGKKKQKYR